MKKLIVLVMLAFPSLGYSYEFTNADGKWVEVGDGVGTVKGYILVEPSSEYIEKKRIINLEIQAKEDAKKNIKTPEQIMIDDLIRRIEILEEK
jgi:hypothetical protein